VETRPIKLISGNSPFCETFFTDVKVPKENLMGPLNGGWTVGKRLLQFERDGQGGNTRGASFRGADTRSLDEIAKHYVGTDAKGRIADPDLRGRIANNMMDAAAMRLTVQRMNDDARSNQGPSAVTSIMKNAQVKVNQDRAELLVEMMGTQALGWEGANYSQVEIDHTRNWLSGKAQSIYGGSNEIQSNIIAKRILGLLDHQ
jgi:alkylation response protein AidB-like acyl-CoA dehydrogenase